MVRDHVAGGRHRQQRVLREVGGGEHHVLHMVEVVRSEHTPPGVEGDAVPARRLVRRLEGAGVRLEPEVHAADRHDGVGRAGRMPAAVIAAVGRVDPVIEAPGEPVDVVLGVGDREPREQRFARVGDAVAIVVAQEKDVGRLDHQDAVAPRQDRGRVQAVGEQGSGLVRAVEVLVDQKLHPTQRQ